MAKQIVFKDDQGIQGGILLDDGTIICACCGGEMPMDEREIFELEILHVYDHWVNLSDEIIGSDKVDKGWG
jgi:transcription elongation factor Elf1